MCETPSHAKSNSRYGREQRKWHSSQLSTHAGRICAGDPGRIVKDVSGSLDMTGAELQKENAPAAQPPERLKITFPNLADLGAQKPAVIFDSYLTTAEQIGHGRDGFAAAFSAGTNGEN